MIPPNSLPIKNSIVSGLQHVVMWWPGFKEILKLVLLEIGLIEPHGIDVLPAIDIGENIAPVSIGKTVVYLVPPIIR